MWNSLIFFVPQQRNVAQITDTTAKTLFRRACLCDSYDCRNCKFAEAARCSLSDVVIKMRTNRRFIVRIVGVFRTAKAILSRRKEVIFYPRRIPMTPRLDRRTTTVHFQKWIHITSMPFFPRFSNYCYTSN